MSRYTQAELDAMQGDERGMRVAVVGLGDSGRTTSALAEAIMADLPNSAVVIHSDQHGILPIPSMKFGVTPFVQGWKDEALRAASLQEVHQDRKPKPKHSNGQYNPVNRKKNKASRKARKQNRR